MGERYQDRQIERLSRPKRPAKLKLGLVLLTILAAGAVAALGGRHYYDLYGEVASAKELLLQAQDSLHERRLDATAEELAAAEAQFEEAGAKFKSSQDALRRDPLVRLLERTPRLGRQIAAGEGVLLMGRDASEIGLVGVAVAEEYNSVRAETANNTSEKAMMLLDRAKPYMAQVGSELDSLLASRRRITDDGLLPPLRDALRQVDEHSGEVEDLVTTYNQAAAFFPDFLGFNGPRTYLVLAQNNAELLPTGGLISVYGVVTLRDGRVEDMSFADAIDFGEQWQERTGEYIEPPPPLKNYLLKDWSWNLALANWSPDFPTAARQAQFFYEKGGGRPVDGVIGINVETLKQLLAVTGPVNVQEYGVTVDPQNVLDVTEALTRSPLEPGGDRKAFAAFLAEQMLHRLMYLPSSQWSALTDTVENLRDTKSVLFYSSDPRLQSVVHDMRLDGALQDPPGDYLMLVEASVNSTKLNIAINENVEMEVALDELGNAHSVVTLHYQNDLPSWEQGRDPQLVRKLMLGGVYGGYLRLLTNQYSRLSAIEVDGTSAGADEISEEGGKAVFGRFFSLPKGASKEVRFTYLTPAIVDLGGSVAEYRLLVQRQPGTGAIPLRLRFALPEGAKPVSLTLDGKPVADGLEVQADLSRDREIVLTYRTDG